MVLKGMCMYVSTCPPVATLLIRLESGLDRNKIVSFFTLEAVEVLHGELRSIEKIS